MKGIRGNSPVILYWAHSLRRPKISCKYISKLWQSEWDGFLENKLFLVLKQYTQTNRKEETDILIAHWPFFYHSFLLNFIEGKERLPLNIFYLLVLILLKQERHFTADLLCVLYHNISPEIFESQCFWKNLNPRVNFGYVCLSPTFF